MLALQMRPFSVGRLFVTATRIPVILVGAAAGGVAYVNHKIEGKASPLFAIIVIAR